MQADLLFVKIDTNKSGTIDANELLKHLLEAGVDTDEISRTFAAIDTDGDGAITKEEAACAGLYRGVAEPLLAAVEKLSFNKLAWTAADWRHMGGALACCTKLRELDLAGMGAGDEGMAAFGGALGSGAAPALKELILTDNKIGVEGMRHLGDALARGAAPALILLRLETNQIGDEGVRHVGDALARGVAPALEVLDLSSNEIGDEGLRHVADALANGAAPALEWLGLELNKIGDEGTRHLADALAPRRFYSLDLDRNPASDDAVEEAYDALLKSRFE